MSDIARYSLRVMQADADARADAFRRAVLASVEDGLITKKEAASMLRTSRSQLDRLLAARQS